jgi:hypothetical protein
MVSIGHCIFCFHRKELELSIRGCLYSDQRNSRVEQHLWQEHISRLAVDGTYFCPASAASGADPVFCTLDLKMKKEDLMHHLEIVHAITVPHRDPGPVKKSKARSVASTADQGAGGKVEKGVGEESIQVVDGKGVHRSWSRLAKSATRTLNQSKASMEDGAFTLQHDEKVPIRNDSSVPTQPIEGPDTAVAAGSAQTTALQAISTKCSQATRSPTRIYQRCTEQVRTVSKCYGLIASD